MEQKIYDLNEYSLEVKDGKAVLKRKGGKEPHGFKCSKRDFGDINGKTSKDLTDMKTQRLF